MAEPRFSQIETLTLKRMELDLEVLKLALSKEALGIESDEDWVVGMAYTLIGMNP